MAIHIKNHLPEIEETCKSNGILFLGIFGSHARNDNSEQSDVDLLVEFSDTKSLLEIAHIQNLFSDMLHKHVDLVQRKSLKQRIKPYIMQDLKTICFSNS